MFKKLTSLMLSLVLIVGVCQQPSHAQFSGTDVQVRFRETDQALPAGYWRLRLQGDAFTIEKNAAAGGDFST